MLKAPEAKGSKESQEISAKNMIAKLFSEFVRDLDKLSNKDRIKRIGEMLFVATVGRFFGAKSLKKMADKKKESESNAEGRPKEKPKKAKNEPEKHEKPKNQPKKIEKTDSSSYEELAKIGDIGRRLALIAEKMIEDGVKGKHCWDWVEQVYKKANVRRNVIYSSFNQYEGKDCGPHHADENLLNQIASGDHIFINNKNKYDVHGNHSVLFLGWTDRSKRIARVASFPGVGNRPAVIQTRNLEKQPVTYIAKPIEV